MTRNIIVIDSFLMFIINMLWNKKKTLSSFLIRPNLKMDFLNLEKRKKYKIKIDKNIIKLLIKKF